MKVVITDNSFKMISIQGTIIQDQKDIKFLQINLNHCGAAVGNMIQYVQENKIDVILVQEPYIFNNLIGLNKDNKFVPLPSGWRPFLSLRRSSGIIIVNPNILAILVSQSPNAVLVNLTTSNFPLSIVSFYSPPSNDFLDDFNFLLNFPDLTYFLIGGDFNAKFQELGYSYTCERAKVLQDFIISKNLLLVNDPDAPSTYFVPFRDHDKKGNPDITLLGSGIKQFLSSWSVDEYSASESDHRYINYTFNLNLPLKCYKRYKTKYSNFKKFNYNFAKLNNNLLNSLSLINNTLELENFIENLTKSIQNIANISFKFKAMKLFPSTPWWTGNLRSRRSKVNALYKKIKSSKDPELKNQYKIKYRKEIAIYKREIKAAKINSWKSFCTSHQEHYGSLFKILNNKLLKHTDFIHSNLETLPLNSDFDSIQSELLNTHFSLSTSPRPEPYSFPVNAPPLTKREFFYAVSCQSLNKAPGHDGIDGRILKNLTTKFFKLFFKLFDKCIQLNYFPKIWKSALPIFFTKKNKNPKNPNSYRPICLLPTLGKLLERIIKNRLTYELEHKNFLNDNQFGFRSHRSTTVLLYNIIEQIKLNLKSFKYCTLISFDIEGAFNNIDHSVIQEIILQLPIENYLKNLLNSFLNFRQIINETKNNTEIFFSLKGCPQGSCLGPSVWTLVADKILKSLPDSLYFKAFADDFVLIEKANSRRSLESATNYSIQIFSDICDSLNLNVSASKTEGTLFGPNLLLNRRPIFKIKNSTIKIVNNLKYLGIILDPKLNFIPHLDYLNSKILDFTTNISRNRGRFWGINYSLLRLWYSTVLEKQLTYGSEAWSPFLNVHGLRKLKSLQRKCILSVSGAYKSSATDGLLTILGIPPLDLIMEINRKKFLLKYINQPVNIQDILINPDEIDFNIINTDIDPTLPIKNIINIENFKQEDINKFNMDLIIYTDGSKNEQGSAYAITANYQNNYIYDYNSRISENNSIFQAELLAIKRAIEWSIFNDYNKVLILSDSQSAIHSILKFYPDNLITVDIFRLLINNPNKKFYLSWIKGHAGIEGNERVDRLAKQPLLNNNPIDNFNIPFPISYLKSLLKQELLAKWQFRWDYLDTGRYTYNFLPTVKLSSLINNKTNRIIFYFLTGHGSFPTFLYKINKLTTDLCICGCQGHPLHYVFDSCPLVPHKFKSNSSLTLFQNFLLIIKVPSLVCKLSENYSHLDQHYSDY